MHILIHIKYSGWNIFQFYDIFLSSSFFFFKFYLFIYLFIYLFYLWLCWVFVSVRGLSLVVASGGHSSSWCAGLSLSRPLLLRSTGSRRAGSVIVAHGPSCSAACGIFPDQGSNPCPLHWQADSQPLRHQGRPQFKFLIADYYKISLDFILYIKLVLIWRKYTFIWFSFSIWHWTIVSVEYFKNNILCVAKSNIITNWRYT